MRLTKLFARESLKVLTPKQREIWILQREMTQEEIAATLGISQPVVAKHLKAAEKKIKKFGESFEETFKTMDDAQPKEIEDDTELDYGEQAANGWAHKTPVRGNPDDMGLHTESWE